MSYEAFWSGVGGVILGTLLGAWVAYRFQRRLQNQNQIFQSSLLREQLEFQQQLLNQQLDFQRKLSSQAEAEVQTRHTQTTSLIEHLRRTLNEKIGVASSNLATIAGYIANNERNKNEN